MKTVRHLLKVYSAAQVWRRARNNQYRARDHGRKVPKLSQAASDLEKVLADAEASPEHYESRPDLSDKVATSSIFAAAVEMAFDDRIRAYGSNILPNQVSRPTIVDGYKLDALKAVCNDYAAVVAAERATKPNLPPDDWRAIVYDMCMEQRWEEAIRVIQSECFRITIPEGCTLRWEESAFPGESLRRYIVVEKPPEPPAPAKPAVEWVFCDYCSTRHEAPECSRFG